MERILAAEDDPSLVRLLEIELSHAGYEIKTVTDGMTALHLAISEHWDLILLDIMLPQLTGIQVLKELRQTLQTPIILLTAKNTEQDIIEGLEAGADDYLTKPFSMGELLARIKTSLRRGTLHKHLQELSYKDTLTGLLNRRGFSEEAALLLKGNKQTRCHVAIMMIDVDNFKNYNDTYGHPAGDSVLQNVAAQLSAAVSGKKALLCRFGGEEFIVLLPDCTLQDAEQIAQTLRAAVEALHIPSGTGAQLPSVTVSIGLAAAAVQDESQLAQCVSLADKALYTAKTTGKNRIVLKYSSTTS